MLVGHLTGLSAVPMRLDRPDPASSRWTLHRIHGGAPGTGRRLVQRRSTVIAGARSRF